MAAGEGSTFQDKSPFYEVIQLADHRKLPTFKKFCLGQEMELTHGTISKCRACTGGVALVS